MAMNEPCEPLNGTGLGVGGGGADEATVLPCGRDLAALWDREEEGRGPEVSRPADDPHTDSCPHCAAAREDLTRLRESVRRDVQEDATDWEAAASRLTAGIMDVVRLELRPGRTLALGGMDEDAWIYEAVAARTFRHAAELVPGVRAGSCRISPAPGPNPGARRPARVRIEVTAAMNLDLQPTADRIRRHIQQAAHRTLGMQITSVEVAVTDLHHEAPGKEPR